MRPHDHATNALLAAGTCRVLLSLSPPSDGAVAPARTYRMSAPPRLAPPPRIALTVARDRTAESRADGGFMNVRRTDLVARYPDGSASEAFAYDVVERRAIDAVAIVAYSLTRGESPSSSPTSTSEPPRACQSCFAKGSASPRGTCGSSLPG